MHIHTATISCMYTWLHLVVFSVAQLEKHAFVRRISGCLDLHTYVYGISVGDSCTNITCMHAYTHACMHACMHVCIPTYHACMHTYLPTSLPADIHTQNTCRLSMHACRGYLLVDLEAHIPLGLRRQLDLHHRRRHLARLRGVESVTAVSLTH